MVNFEEAVQDPANQRILRDVAASFVGELGFDELYSAALTGLWRAARSHRPEMSHFGQSARRFARWECLRALEKARKQPKFQELNEQTVLAPEEEPAPNEELEQFLGLLNEKEQFLVRAHWLAGESYRAIGQHFKVSKESARLWCRAAFEKLQQLVYKLHGESE